MKYSNNKKLNAVLNEIENQISFAFEGCVKEGIKHYMEDYPKDADYSIAQNGCLLCYYSDIYDMYSDCGYKTTSKMSTDAIWKTYLRQVGYVARQMLKA